MPSALRLFLASLLVALASTAVAQPRLTLELDRTSYLENQESNLYLKTTINTGDQETSSERPPANIVFLVDRSGSMEGEKLAALKSALRDSLTHLSDDDRIALVAFGSTVTTLIPSLPVDQLVTAPSTIENLATDGGSALYAGLEQAAAELKKSASDRSFDRILLICDGPPNKGSRELADFAQLATDLARENISIAAFALGSEAPTDLLFRIVAPSNGPLYNAPEPSDLSNQLATEFQYLNFAIGKDAILEIEFTSSIDIVESIGRQADQSRRSITFRFEKLLANQELSTLVQATIPASKTTFSQARIAKARLSYQPTQPLNSPPIVIEASVDTRFTPSSSRSFNSIAPHVYQSVCEGEVADTIREAVEAVQQGKSKQALRDLKKLSRNIRSVADDIPELQIQASLDQLTKAIDTIENASQSAIEERAFINTLYPTPAASASDTPQ